LSAIPNSPSRREYHLNYEIWMLEETNRKPHVDEVIKNALIESFCVHARNLFEFFMEEAPQYTHDYRPFSRVTKSRRKAILKKLNVHITHVKFQGRATNDADKITDPERGQMLNILSDEIREFRTHLMPQYSAAEIRDLPRVPIGPSLASGPHTTTTTSSTVSVTTLNGTASPWGAAASPEGRW
jgi:hypothetical protein